MNASGDEEGCRLENGVVRTPTGFREAYAQFREGGWTALAGRPEYGGQGLPESVNKLVEEMICASQSVLQPVSRPDAWRLQAIEQHGTEELKDAYLPKMVEAHGPGRCA